MTLWPRGVLARLALASAAALLLLTALELLLRQRDAAALAAARSDPEAARASLPEGADGAGLLRTGGVEVENVVLCGQDGPPDGVAAVWQLLRSGAIVARRPPPLATGPGRQRLARAAIALPVAALPALTPEQRAGLLDLLSGLWPERPPSRDRLQLDGVAGGPDDVDALLRWLR